MIRTELLKRVRGWCKPDNNSFIQPTWELEVKLIKLFRSSTVISNTYFPIVFGKQVMRGSVNRKTDQ